MMKNNQDKSFKDVLNDSIDESILEYVSHAYTGTNALGTSQSNKYSPANVRTAPPLRRRNGAIEMGQTDNETRAPKQLAYPFEGMFSEMVEIFTQLESIKRRFGEAKELANLSDAKKKAIGEAEVKLELIVGELKQAIEKIEEVTV